VLAAEIVVLSVLASYLSTVIGALVFPATSRQGWHWRRNSAS